jgi:hypothetical protein
LWVSFSAVGNFCTRRSNQPKILISLHLRFWPHLNC